ncbi:hypothetical protein TD95_001508 [Thielaviopsis punctulata]|uniref:Vacuolar calcium ion transporter n=1 Tax=Thielaviopsis punctulata TaxID=72032 RepID=A0A0F4ZJH9_9PEZI|nr:hypothetical protein TD95_001508 [Thielaviopsis punctulata]
MAPKSQSSNLSIAPTEVNESSPLLVGRSTDSVPRTPRLPPTRRGTPFGDAKWRDILLNSQSTPGTDSQNIIIRSLSSVWHVFKVTLLSSYVNFLLIAVPFGIIAGENHWESTLVFSINFFAIIPLAAVLSFATEEISMKLGETLGGLLNATFGNAVELIVSIVALRDGQIEVVQASMLGSILSNLLLVMGMCFFFGGLKNMNDTNGHGREQTFASATAQTTCSMMTLSAASLVIPAALSSVLQGTSDDGEQAKAILTLSHYTAIILLALYVMYLVFQLKTHKNLFDGSVDPVTSISDTETAISHNEIEEEEEPILSPYAAIGVLVVTTILVSICADYLVGSIDDLVEQAHISKSFIGLILIPIVGNAAEHVTAVVVAVRDKMDLAMGVAIGSSIQIALLVTPFLVIVGWIMGQPMTLHFEMFQTVAFAFSVLVVTYTVLDGRSNYLEGAMLMGLYIIIAIAFYVSPASL